MPIIKPGVTMNKQSDKPKDIIVMIGKMTAREIQKKFINLYVIANSEYKNKQYDRVEITVRDRSKDGNRELRVMLLKDAKDGIMDYTVLLSFPYMPKELLKTVQWWPRNKKLNIADPKSLTELEEWLTQNVHFLMTLPPKRSKSRSESI